MEPSKFSRRGFLLTAAFGVAAFSARGPSPTS